MHGANGSRRCRSSRQFLSTHNFLTSFTLMTLEYRRHSAILSPLFKMDDDDDLIGASEFKKGKFGVFNAVSLFLWVLGGGNQYKHLSSGNGRFLCFHSEFQYMWCNVLYLHSVSEVLSVIFVEIITSNSPICPNIYIYIYEWIQVHYNCNDFHMLPVCLSFSRSFIFRHTEKQTQEHNKHTLFLHRWWVCVWKVSATHHANLPLLDFPQWVFHFCFWLHMSLCTYICHMNMKLGKQPKAKFINTRDAMHSLLRSSVTTLSWSESDKWLVCLY